MEKKYKMSDKIYKQLKEYISELLGIDENQITKETSLFQLGIDSVMMMTVVKEINNLFDVDLSLSNITFKYNTFQLISDYIAEVNKAKESEKNQIKNKIIIENNEEDDLMLDNQEQKEISVEEKKVPEKKYICQVQDNPYQNIYDICREQKETLEHVFVKQLEVLQSIQGIDNVKIEKTNSKKVVTENVNNSTVSTVSNPDDKYRIVSAADSNISIKKEKPLTKNQCDMLNSLIDSLTKKNSKSKELAAKYRKYLADLDEVAGFSLLLKEIHYQISIESGQGSKMSDVDGNSYVDLAMGFGSLILGYSPKIVMDALKDEFSRGIQIAPRHRLVGEVAKLVCELTGFDRATFTVTGTEAAMTVMKFARTYSRKDKIGVFTGCYHGHNDATLITRISANDSGRPLAPGISKAALDDMILFDYNDMSSLDKIVANKDKLAAVIIEPVQSRRPEVQPVEFLEELRRVTKENGILLIFDEVITGFRCSTGGAKKYFCIDPDMAIYGKAACNGLPIGIVAGKAEVMDVADGGMWQYGDDSYPEVEQTFYAGTFFKHPFTMGAAYAILNYYKKDGGKLQKRLAENVEKLVGRLNEVFEKYDAPIRAKNFTSLFRFQPVDDFSYMDIFYYELLDHGVFTWEGRTCFLSEAHTAEDVDKIVEATKKSVEDMKKAGFFGDEAEAFTLGLPDELYYD